MDGQEDGKGAPRRRYEKPKIVRVLLNPEEAVLGFCKNANKSGPLKAKCNLAGNCATLGS